MDIEPVDQVVASATRPIAFPLFHQTNLHDQAFMGVSGAMPIWNEEWARVGVAIHTHSKGGSPQTIAKHGRRHMHYGNEIGTGDDLNTITI